MNQISFRSKAFTLIELLVVASIISLMASIVLASLTSARAKAVDSTIKGNMQTIRSVSEFYYDNHSDYGTPFVATTFYVGTCPNQGMFSDPKVQSAIAGSLALVGGTDAVPACAIGVNGQSWSISVPLKTSGTWCVGSGGFAIANRYPGGGDTVAADCSATTPPLGAAPGGGGGGS